MPRLTEAQFLAKFLRKSAEYHAPSQQYVVVDVRFMRALRQLGVQMEAPATRIVGELTPAQAIRYAEQLEKIDANRGAA